jgi:membrane-bound ClpP family serine protease
LLSKLQAWLGSGQLQAQLQAARTPFTLVAGLIALLVVLRIYGALLAVIDSFPLAPGLLELVGVIAVVRFGLVKLVRSQERRALIEGLQQRWKAFQGKA